MFSCRRANEPTWHLIESQALSDHGVSFVGEWTFDNSVLLKGGLNEGSAASRNLLDLYAELDAETMFGWPDGKLMLHFQNLAGEFGSADVGDFHVYDNIDNPDNFAQLAEIYFQQQLLDDQVTILLGKVDANSHFNFSEVAGDFINSGKGNNPTTYDVMPTYPDPATSVIAFLQPNDQFAIGVGIFDGRLAEGVSTGGRGFDLGGPYWIVAEMQLKSENNETRLAAGVWHHTFSAFERFDGRGTEDGMTGVYLNLDQALWTLDDRGLYLNLNYGRTDEAINTFPRSVTAALIWNGSIIGLNQESFGVGMVWGDLSDDLPGIDQDDETHVEMYYRFAPSSNVTLQPVVTYMDEPTDTPGIRDTVIATLRMIVEF